MAFIKILFVLKIGIILVDTLLIISKTTTQQLKEKMLPINNDKREQLSKQKMCLQIVTFDILGNLK